MTAYNNTCFCHACKSQPCKIDEKKFPATWWMHRAITIGSELDAEKLTSTALASENNRLNAQIQTMQATQQ